METKQRLIDELMSRQPTEIKRAYEEVQKLAAMQPFSLEEELERIRMEAEISPNSLEDNYAGPSGPLGGQKTVIGGVGLATGFNNPLEQGGASMWPQETDRMTASTSPTPEAVSSSTRVNTL